MQDLSSTVSAKVLLMLEVMRDIVGTLSTDDGNGDGRGYWENPNYQTRMSGAKMPSRSRHVAT